MSFDEIFDRPEIIPGLNDLDLEVTTYTATATHTGTEWTVTARDLPGGRTVHAQGSTWRIAETEIHQRVTQELAVDPTTVVVSMTPADPDAAAALSVLASARIARANAEQAERDAARNTARLLASQGWAVHDTAGALRLPAERIAHLTTATTNDRGHTAN